MTDWSKIWTIAKKDMESVKTYKYVLYSLIALPVVFSVVLPIMTIYPMIILGPPQDLSMIMWGINMTLVMFMFIPAAVPSVIASYSIVGEKVNKQLEPLLATPTTDEELLLGKSLGAFLPGIGATFASFFAFTVIVNAMTYDIFKSFLLPNLQSIIIIFVFAPMIGIMAVEWCVFVSSKVTDVRAANQLGIVAGVPVFAFYFLFLGGILALEASVLIIFFLALLGISLALYYLSRITFRREEILTKWK